MKNAWVIGAMALGLTGTVPVLAADDAADSAAGAGVRGITVQYSGSVMIFQVADIVVNGQFANDDYSASARLTTAGLAALFSDADIEAGVSGYRYGPRLQPWRYSHYNHASSKNRTVGIDFPDGVATPNIEPPFGNMGEPPATAEERAGAADPLSTGWALPPAAIRCVTAGCRSSTAVPAIICASRMAVQNASAPGPGRAMPRSATPITSRSRATRPMNSPMRTPSPIRSPSGWRRCMAAISMSPCAFAPMPALAG